MEFKTTTGGQTTLSLFAHELDLLRGHFPQLTDEQLAKKTETVLRANPLSTFEQVVGLMCGAGVASAPQTALQDARLDLANIEAHVRGKIKEANSMQVEAVLLGALTSVHQTKLLLQVAENMLDRLDQMIERKSKR